MNDDDLRILLNERLEQLNERITETCARSGRSTGDVKVIAVSKTVSPRVIRLMAELGQTEFGENRAQQLWERAAALSDLHFHFIGPLQRNKLDRLLQTASYIHSIDSFRLLDALALAQRKYNHPAVPCLLEFKLSADVNKHGFTHDQLPLLLNTLPHYQGLNIQGLMTMADYDANAAECRMTFAELRGLRDTLQKQTGMVLPELSMGMSGDFDMAILEGATMIRPGSLLFDGLSGC
jgi:hypothetical protein